METNLLKNLLDLNNLIENFESQVRVVNRKNFKATEFDPVIINFLINYALKK